MHTNNERYLFLGHEYPLQMLSTTNEHIFKSQLRFKSIYLVCHLVVEQWDLDRALQRHLLLALS